MSERAEVAGRLASLLGSEEALYREMRDLLRAERRHMTALDAGALEDIVRQKVALAEEGRLLEDGRAELCARLGALLDLGTARPTLSQLCEALGPEAGELPDVHGRLAALAGAVQELLRANEALAGEALSRVQGTLQRLGRLPAEDPTYTREGAPTARAGGRLLRQAV